VELSGVLLRRAETCARCDLLKFPAQGILQGKFSRKKISHGRTRINTGDSQSTREPAGNEQGIPQMRG